VSGTQNVAAGVVLTLLAATLVVWLVRAVRRSPYTPRQSLVYAGNVLLTRVLWRARVPARLPIPLGQGAVLVANHRSSVDPFFIQLAAHRVVYWMVAREYFAHWALGWFLRTTEAIPTRRTGLDTAATLTAIRLAASGEVLGVLPEGRINTTDELLLPARPGAVLIALRARVPIVPCYIDGAPYAGTYWSPFFLPARVRVVFGQPIDLSAHQGRERDEQLLRELTLDVMRQIAHLAGRDDFQPRLAGRRWLGEGGSGEG